MNTDIPWWKKATVYQVYPRSYCDSNGDGIGDLNGIISKLDYIHDLGVDAIWFSPFFKSPQEDFGYDISDYRDIAPEYGTMDTCERLIKEVHDRDMKIVLDIVLNHTSAQHPWFIESRSSKDNPKRDWYIWRDGRKPGGKKPPNNWRAMITGSGWHYDETTDQWYWAQFLPFQPDLNYRNPEVRDEMLDTLRFWLKKGADGFRLDIINALFEDDKIRDNPRSCRLLPSEDNAAMLFVDPIHTLNHPETLEFMKKLRSVVDEFSDPPRFMVGEVSAPLKIVKQYMGEQADGLHLTFQFQSLRVPLKTRKVKNLIINYEKHFQEPFLPTWVFSNHDMFRRISTLGGSIEKGKLNVALQLTARGVPFIYYGEEIGMEQHHLPVKQSLDAITFKFKNVPQFFFDVASRVFKLSLNRDECRTPMQWTPEANAGFCTQNVEPWLPLTPSFVERNVKMENADDNSLLHCYKRFIKARKASSALNAGDFTFLTGKNYPNSILAYQRSAGAEGCIIYLNMSSNEVTFPAPSGYQKLLVSTHVGSVPPTDGQVILHSWEGIVLVPE